MTDDAQSGDTQSDDTQSGDELPRLLSALEDGTLDLTDEARLVELLQTDPAARAKYYDHVILAALLRREGRREAAQIPDDADSSRHAPRDEPLTLTVRNTMYGRRSWLIALAASGLLALVLSVGEATGVTQLVPTIVRIVTGEGSLVIEVDDPSVSVTLDGQDITITGAGIHELRLRPGTHEFVATRDGQPAHTEMVSIARGGKQVVRVSLEAAAPTSQTAPVAERNAFVVLSREGAQVRKCDTLAEAVLGASDGDTIEIRGNGPFVSEAIANVNTAITIRAGDGFRPVVCLSEKHLDSNLLECLSALTLEGLELRRRPPAQKCPSVVACFDAPLYVANCRIVAPGVSGLSAHRSGICLVRNCEFFGPSASSFTADIGAKDRWVIDNCLHVTTGMVFRCGQQPLEPASLVLSRNTIIRDAALFDIYLPSHESASHLTIQASDNVFDTRHLAWLWFPASSPGGDRRISLPGVFRWSGERNLCDIRDEYWGATLGEAKQPVAVSTCKSLADWSQLWSTVEPGSLEGGVRYQGGDLRSKTIAGPGQVVPADFRLRADSPGYRTGKDGKDLGAEIDLVGPGAAYERWKKTPEYQQWLKETGQKSEL